MTSGDIWQSTQHGAWREGGRDGEREGGREEGAARGVEESRRNQSDRPELGSHQLSGFSCVSMSTRQIGHFLLVASHWSTQPWWKRCMQGSLLEVGNKWIEGSVLIHNVKHEAVFTQNY